MYGNTVIVPVVSQVSQYFKKMFQSVSKWLTSVSKCLTSVSRPLWLVLKMMFFSFSFSFRHNSYHHRRGIIITIITSILTCMIDPNRTDTWVYFVSIWIVWVVAERKFPKIWTLIPLYTLSYINLYILPCSQTER